MVGRLLSFWDGIFSVAMLNFQGVGGSLVLFFVSISPRCLGKWIQLEDVFLICIETTNYSVRDLCLELDEIIVRNSKSDFLDCK